jgi:hypothetical protein
MLHRKSKINLVILSLIALFPLLTHAQTNSEIALYTKFDSIVGKENLGLNNGPLALNLYKTVGDNSMFLNGNQSTIGNVYYDEQPYFNVKLKYDIFKDQLLLNPPGQPEHIWINLIQDKMSSFSMYGKNFVKLTKNESSIAEFTSGYYELIKISETFRLYIRHHKDIQKQINDDGINYFFKQNNQYYIDYNSKFYEITSKSSVLKIFPLYKKQINDFYQKNRSLIKTDNDQFINSLMISIYNFSINNSK